MENAVVYRVQALPFVKGSVLQVTANERTYQFGFNPWAHPVKHFPFSIEEREETMRYSTFSIVIRVAAVAYALYLLVDWLR